MGPLQVMTVCDLGCASSVMCAERFRTVAKPVTAGAHTPADLYASGCSVLAAVTFPDQVVL